MDEYDSLCLEAIDAGMDDWVEDPAGMEHEDCTWMDLTLPCERTAAASPKDVCDDSMDDYCSDDRKCIDVNKDT